MNPETARASLLSKHPNLTEIQLDRLLAYLSLLDRWNRKTNLTSLDGPDRVSRLISGPIEFSDAYHPSGTLLDIGSGGGSPAIPLLCVSPFKSACLVEARSRKCAFLREVLAQLGLSQATVIQGRFPEDCSRTGVNSLITVQAVKLSTELLRALGRHLEPAGAIAWFTHGQTGLFQAAREITLAAGNSKVHIFLQDS